MPKPKIAIFSGPTATIQNSEPLVTSNKARAAYGLPPKTAPDGTPLRWDPLRPQRLAAPVTVYVEQFSAHPLEKDTAELYAAPDGYVDAAGCFHTEPTSPSDKAVYKIELLPEDGVYPLPYYGRQADGSAWEEECAFPGASYAKARQGFYPDASRIVEEIDRLGLGASGWPNLLSSLGDFDFYRAAPSGGYTKGLPSAERTDVGEGDIAPELPGDDYFFYKPAHLRREPPRGRLAKLTNIVQNALATGQYDGAIWLEGSPHLEETIWWLNLLIDTKTPICGNSSQRPHGALANDGDHNIVDSAEYITSGVWKGEDGSDTVGAVAILDEWIYTSREVQKGDAHPGGYVATGGHGGIVGGIGHGAAVLTFRPNRKHTYTSEVKTTCLPTEVLGSKGGEGGIMTAPVAIKDAAGDILESAIPMVTVVKHTRYHPLDSTLTAETEVDVLARIAMHLRDQPLAGIVAEGSVGGSVNRPVELALERAVFSGMPVVRVGRGNNEGFTNSRPGALTIAGSNLTATKGRLLLMACIMKFGGMPPAADPCNPTAEERKAVQAKVAEFQAVFDTH